jgi:hypothetical protein
MDRLGFEDFKISLSVQSLSMSRQSYCNLYSFIISHFFSFLEKQPSLLSSICVMHIYFRLACFQTFPLVSDEAGNTKGGSITLLTSSLTALD